ncbi:MAG: hypothetical protein RR385_09790 [Clostridiales bacterium]
MNNRNHEHYRDPTAAEAVKNVSDVDEHAAKVIKTVKAMLRLCGFELINRIEIKHKGTGGIYR